MVAASSSATEAKSSLARREDIISNRLGAGWLAILQIDFVPIEVSRRGADAYGHIGFHVVAG
ncbi:MAG: hypothetical protein AB7U83_23775 [Vicinamibacterales bacterium]